MTKNEEIMLQVVGDLIRKQVADVRAQVTAQIATLAPGQQLPQVYAAPPVYNQVGVPDVHVRNEVGVPSVIVQVDMAPVAAALDRLATLYEDTIRGLVAALAARPAIEFSPTVKAPSVTVEAPNITVAAPAVEARKPRRLRVTHDDGSSSIISEE